MGGNGITITKNTIYLLGNVFMLFLTKWKSIMLLSFGNLKEMVLIKIFLKNGILVMIW